MNVYDADSDMTGGGGQVEVRLLPDGTIAVVFSQPMQSFGLTPELALELAAALRLMAEGGPPDEGIAA